jgi:hypothetical protein
MWTTTAACKSMCNTYYARLLDDWPLYVRPQMRL